MSLVAPLNSNFVQSVNHFEPQPHLACPRIDFFNLLQFCPITLTLEEFVAELPKQLDDASLIRFIQSNKNVAISNDLKHSIILGAFSTHRISDRTVQFLIEKLNPEIGYSDFIRLVKKYGYAFVPPIMNKFVDLYKTSFPAQDFDILEYLFGVSKNDGLLQFWNKHSKYLMSEETLEKALQGWAPSIVNFLKWLHEQGVPSKWFNTPDAKNCTGLQRIAGRGDIELVNTIAKNIPQDQIKLVGDLAFEEEMRDCFIQGKQIDLSRFDRNKTMIAQNGCRTVIMTDVGEIYSYPGQDASKLAQQMANGADVDSFTIYHNPGHASIAFSDAHFGFYPARNPNGANIGFAEVFQDAIARQGAVAPNAEDSKTGGATLGTLGKEYGYNSFTDFCISNIAVAVPRLIWGSKNIHSQHNYMPCAVRDDSAEKIVSDSTNELTLKVYALKDKVEAVRQYAIKVQDACKAGDTTADYHALSNNCIDFVRHAVQASGSNADYRDSFHTMQYFRRPGFVNFYTMFRSNQPMIQSNSSLLDAASISEAVDRVSRNTVLGGVLSIPGSIYAYLVYKGIPRAVASISRASSRIQLAAFAICRLCRSIGAMGR